MNKLTLEFQFWVFYYKNIGHYTSKTGIGQPLLFISDFKVKLQFLEFTKGFKCPFIPVKVF